jgi:hypothetical protein
MESGVTRGDLKRDKFWTVMVFLLALFAFLVVFQPIRRVESGKFRDVAFTYRYEQPLSPSEAQRDKLRDALKKALIEAKVDDARVSFPTTTEVRKASRRSTPPTPASRTSSARPSRPTPASSPTASGTTPPSATCRGRPSGRSACTGPSWP